MVYFCHHQKRYCSSEEHRIAAPSAATSAAWRKQKASDSSSSLVFELRKLARNCSKPSLVFFCLYSLLILSFSDPSPCAVSISRETYKHDPVHNGLKGSIDAHRPEGRKSAKLRENVALERVREKKLRQKLVKGHAAAFFFLFRFWFFSAFFFFTDLIL